MPKEADKLSPQELRKIRDRINIALGLTETPSQSAESPHSPDQNPQPELTPVMTKQALEGVKFGPTQQSIVDALLESFDQGLESNSLTRIAFASSSYAARFSRRPSLKGMISNINTRTRPLGVEIYGEKRYKKQLLYRWQRYHSLLEPHPESKTQTPAAEDLLWEYEPWQDTPPPVSTPRETVINISPESRIFTEKIGRNFAYIVTSQILREKNASNPTLIADLPTDILELSTPEQRSKIDIALAPLTVEEKRQVLLQSTITAIESAWAMSQARKLDSNEDLATTLNCHGLARRGHFLGEITMRLSEHFQTERL